MNSKSILILSAALAAMGAFADPNAPQITSCTVTQDPATHLVKATYTLDEPAVITFDVKTNGVSIGGANLTHAYGDVHRIVTAGSHTLYWQADKSWQGYRLASDFSVVAWATNAPPDYMVVDCLVKKGERTYYIAPEQLPDGGVTNRKYKTDYLVMRKIPAKDVIYPMGLMWNDSGMFVYHRVKFTNDFYMAVYELTRGQWLNVIGSKCSLSWIDPAESPEDKYYLQRGLIAEQGAAYAASQTVPVPQQRYTDVRGSTKTWQTDGHDIDSGCKLQTFRTTLGISTLDLPTEAQWEFACRAGTTGDRFDGTGGGTRPDAIAWVRANTPMIEGASNPLPQEVGLLQPNPFGLYDIFGNVPEMCLDYYNEGSAYAILNNNYDGAPVVEPSGATTDLSGNVGDVANHVVRGGGVWNDTYSTVAYDRTYNKRTGSSNEPIFGYRLVCLP